MKILIVEDEVKTREGIEKLIRMAGPGYEIIGTAKNGVEGIEIATKEKPELIITDIRMNVMDGLEMIRHLNDLHFSCKYLILSGYADFQYARQAMNLGSVDYLLKPMTREMLEEALKKIEVILKAEASSIQVSAFDTEELFRRIILTPEFNEPQVEKEFQSRFNPDERLHLLLIKGENRFVEKDRVIIQQWVRQAFSGRTVFLCSEEGTSEIYALICDGDSIQVKQILKQKMKKLCQDTHQDEVFSLTKLTGVEHLQKAVGKVRDNAVWSLTLGEDYLIDEELLSGLNLVSFHYPTHLEHAITRKISTGELQGVEEDVNAFIGYLKQKPYSCLDIREALVCLTVAVLYGIRTASYGVYENISHLNLMDWVQRLLFVDHYGQIILNILSQYQQYQEGIHNNTHPLIRKVLRLLDQEYRAELSLEEMAGRLSVTPEYLSSLFIRELGVRFTTYYTQRRIEHAKGLLLDKNLKIYEVAEDSGYTDVKYFCKVFKKYTGVSPGEFQKNQS